jgi:general secretion pathway protein D
VAQQGAVTSHRETNLLIITDTGANIRRLLDILKLADVQVALDELQVIPIKNADAQELALLLNQMFATGRLRTAASAIGLPVAAPAPPAAPRPAGTDGGQSADRAPLIVAERRSNSLVIHARKQEIETILQLIAKLDIDIYGGQRVFIYFVEYSKAKDLRRSVIWLPPGRARPPARCPGPQSPAARARPTRVPA